jgi:hypothetical protein
VPARSTACANTPERMSARSSLPAGFERARTCPISERRARATRGGGCVVRGVHDPIGLRTGQTRRTTRLFPGVT